jgi:hypothetical protein
MSKENVHLRALELTRIGFPYRHGKHRHHRHRSPYSKNTPRPPHPRRTTQSPLVTTARARVGTR